MKNEAAAPKFVAYPVARTRACTTVIVCGRTERISVSAVNVPSALGAQLGFTRRGG
jgi:hypothetical protein